MHTHLKSLVTALAFSLLFYSKTFGLNLVLIAILVVVLLSTLKAARPVPWIYPAAYLFTALMVFIHPTGFHIFAHLLTFLLLVGKSMARESSLYVAVFVGFINMLTASIIRLAERQKRPETERKKLSPKAISRIKGVVLAGALLCLFGVLYQKGNPIFEWLLSQIDLSFINFPWILFTCLGYLLFLHLLRPYDPQELVKMDTAQENDLSAPEEKLHLDKLYQLDSEQTLGSIVLGALNLLLIGFLITDLLYLLQPDIHSHADYSRSVHQGVYALMFSIVCAILIILYFFRGALNFFKGNGRLKKLAYLWIGLNGILVLFTAYKNWSYIEALGFTYKRIGVFIYLLLVLVGLVTTYLKVAQKKRFVYLLRTNLATAWAFLVLASAVPWDKAITAYNLSHLQDPDIHYLLDLGASNAPQLYTYGREKKHRLNPNLRARISNKYLDFEEEEAGRSWQEYTLHQFLSKNTDR
ncbi:DUF4173 domain-containing protein [Flavobacteriaceae bacterium 3-367]|uniref:DUF4153 domain-containing protein n=1 Tax=Eudoraea algarum TaxID=3417568 RepID=UPI00326CC8D6